MKTFASALLASSALGATAIIDFSMKGTYYLTRDPEVAFSVRELSGDNGASDSTIATSVESANSPKYGAIKFTYTLSTALASLSWSSVTLMNMWNVLKSSGAGGTGQAATADIGFDLFMCFKDGQTQTADVTRMVCWITSFQKAATPSSNATGANFMYDVVVYQYHSQSATANTVSQIVFAAGNVTTGGVEKTTTGFGTTANWTNSYKQKKADLTLATSGDQTIATTSGASSPAVDWAAASPNTGSNIDGIPSVVITNASATLFAVAATYTYKLGTDSSLFQTNGPKWSGAMRAFDQGTALNMFGFRWQKAASSGTGFSASVLLRKLTLDSATSVVPNERWTTIDSANTADTTTIWSSTIGKATGVTTATAQLDLFVKDDAAANDVIVVRVQQDTVLTTAVTTTSTKSQVQQMVCLNFYTNSTSIQYFCFLAESDIAGNATSELGTTTFKHSVWWMTAAPTLAMYSASGTTGTGALLFDGTSVNLNNSNSKGWLAYEATSAATIAYGQEASFTASIPNVKFQSMMGNYVARDRKTIRSTMGFQGDADSAGSPATANTNLQAGTLKTIKDGCTSAGFAGTALKIAAGTPVSQASATAAFTTTDPNATTCTTMTEATCKSTYTLVKSGALSTIASVGAAIAALAMSF